MDYSNQNMYIRKGLGITGADDPKLNNPGDSPKQSRKKRRKAKMKPIKAKKQVLVGTKIVMYDGEEVEVNVYAPSGRQNSTKFVR